MIEVEEIDIQDVPVAFQGRRITGFTEALEKLKPGQSFVYHKSLNTAYRLIRCAQGRKKNPVRGLFKVIHDLKGEVRIGRIS